jgi:hypothetical protein
VSYDWGKEVEVVSANGIAGGGLEWKNHFENLFKNNVTLIVTWVLIGLAILSAIIVGIILLKCLCNKLSSSSQS